MRQSHSKDSQILDGVPLVVVEHGELLHERMRKAGVDENDILAAARELQGLDRLDQIKYAVLERSGRISIIPRSRKVERDPTHPSLEQRARCTWNWMAASLRALAPFAGKEFAEVLRTGDQARR